MNPEFSAFFFAETDLHKSALDSLGKEKNRQKHLAFLPDHLQQKSDDQFLHAEREHVGFFNLSISMGKNQLLLLLPVSFC